MEFNAIVDYLILFSMLFLSVTLCFCLLRGMMGPRFTDRTVAVSIISGKTILIIAALAVYLKAPYLLDICLIFSIISFLAVVVLNNTYLLKFNRRMATKNRAVPEAQDNGD